MVAIPAICKECGTIFPSSISIENSINISFKNVQGGTCPKCSGVGIIPDGVYDSINNTIYQVFSKHYTKEELLRFKELFQKAAKYNFDYEKLNEEAEKENLSLSDVFPQNREELRTDIKWFITTILAVIALLVSVGKIRDNKPEIVIRPEEVIRYIYDNPEKFDLFDEGGN